MFLSCVRASLRPLALVCVCAAGTYGACASAVGATPSFSGAAQGAATHPDPVGDAPNGGADISGVDVGNDFIKGSYVIWINLANRTSFTGNDTAVLLIDSDLNSSTGASGYDYGVEDDGGNCILDQILGADVHQIPAPTLACDFRGNAVRLEFNPSDIGGSMAINFYTVTYNGDARSDVAPDSGFYSYSAGSGVVPLGIAQFALAPKAPKAGKSLVARMDVVRTDILETLGDGTVTCRLRAGGKTIAARTADFVSDFATCAWSIPKSAKRKALTGSISVTFGGSTVTKTFTARAG